MLDVEVHLLLLLLFFLFDHTRISILLAALVPKVKEASNQVSLLQEQQIIPKSLEVMDNGIGIVMFPVLGLGNDFPFTGLAAVFLLAATFHKAMGKFQLPLLADIVHDHGASDLLFSSGRLPFLPGIWDSRGF